MISKILLPTLLLTAISPNPFLATMTEVIRSGTLVPAARIVIPIKLVSILNVAPIVSVHQTISVEKTAIHVKIVGIISKKGSE